ncbi:MAG: sugar phosphate nucleotidyltransferase [Acidobacteriota bacterium]|nr:sugar phosphate nucleotidyltransferase [Acidobacteriota bacterium]
MKVSTNKPQTIILCGGAINHSSLPIRTNQSNAMIPINGKPVIGWILDELLLKGIRHVTVVLREQDSRLQAFLQRAYAGRMEVATAPLREEGTIVQSIGAGICRTPTDGLVRIILGDTLIRDSFEGDHDFVYTGEVEDSRRWCVVVTAHLGQVVDFIDKQELFNPPYKALAGYYHLCHGDHLRTCVERSVANGESELSDVLRRYQISHPIQAQPVKDWFDLGHIDNLVDARRRLLQPRYFNSLTINPVLNTITKVSQHSQKLQDELAWYQNIPDELKILAPRILVNKEIDGKVQISQEYYGYPTLAELYTYGELHTDIWLSILRHVLRIHQEFRRYSGQLEPELVRAMYANKTWERLTALREQDAHWQSLLTQDVVVFNGRELRNIYALEEAINTRAQALADSAPISVIHGDFCFSNILFDINNQIIRLIDPRGSFGRSGIYGDSRYDMAKLRHSVSGLYDYIMADMFELKETSGDYSGQIYIDGRPQIVAAEFDRMLSAIGYNLDEIRFIEGLLFVSMVPLHKGNRQRQQLLYLTGLSLLNEVL